MFFCCNSLRIKSRPVCDPLFSDGGARFAISVLRTTRQRLNGVPADSDFIAKPEICGLWSHYVVERKIALSEIEPDTGKPKHSASFPGFGEPQRVFTYNSAIGCVVRNFYLFCSLIQLSEIEIAMQEQKSDDRRGFGKKVLGSLLTYSMLETVLASEALADTVKPIAAKWLADVNQMSVELKGAKLKQLEWQKQVEQLFSQVNVAEFLSFVDFEKLIKTVEFRERGEKSFRATFPGVEGLPTDLVFGHQMFALRKGRSVVPHGHNNMATSFLILQGDFEGKHYDRLDETDDHMIIKPTIDQRFGRGDYSTISDHKDNVHWFKATSGPGFIFNIHVLNVDPEIKRSGRVYVDPDGEKLSGGRIKAEKLKSAEAFRRYG